MEIGVSFTFEPDGTGEAQSVKGEPYSMKSIFVGNLSNSVTEGALRSLFEAHGSVERVRILTDRGTGQPRGFGFVDMTNDADAVKAIAALNGKDLEGQTLNVTEARPDPSGGRGFGRKRW
jgi:cold-inducible RNA-binding protein